MPSGCPPTGRPSGAAGDPARPGHTCTRCAPGGADTPLLLGWVERANVTTPEHGTKELYRWSQHHLRGFR
eukprot:7092620-Prymnesium_polylepis.1